MEPGNEAGEWVEPGNEAGEWMKARNEAGEWVEPGNEAGEWVETGNGWRLLKLRAIPSLIILTLAPRLGLR